MDAERYLNRGFRSVQTESSVLVSSEMRAQLGSGARQNVRAIIEVRDNYRASIEPAIEAVHKGAGTPDEMPPKLKPHSVTAKLRALQDRLEAFDGSLTRPRWSLARTSN